MANVSFHVGTTTPGSSGLTADGLYVDKTNGQIFYATSTTAKKQIGSSMKMMSDKGWTVLNGTTGTALTSLSSSVRNTIVTYARDIDVVIKAAPKNLIFPATSETGTFSRQITLTKSYNDANTFKSLGAIFGDMITVSDNYETTFIREIDINISTSSVTWTYQRIRQNSDPGDIITLGNTRTESISSYIYIRGYRF